MTPHNYVIWRETGAHQLSSYPESLSHQTNLNPIAGGTWNATMEWWVYRIRQHIQIAVNRAIILNASPSEVRIAEPDYPFWHFQASAEP